MVKKTEVSNQWFAASSTARFVRCFLLLCGILHFESGIVFAQYPPVQIQPAFLGNGTTVLDIRTMGGTTFTAKLQTAAARLANSGGTINTLGLNGAQEIISSTIVLPANVTLLIGNLQIQCIVAPCIEVTNNDKLLGFNSGDAAPVGNVAGSLIWEYGLSGSLIKVVQSAPPSFTMNVEIGGLVIENATAIPNNGTYIFTGTGLDLGNNTTLQSWFHDLTFVGFSTQITGSYGYYNHFERIFLDFMGSYGANFTAAWNSNLFDMIEINPGDARGAVGFNLSGAECTGTHFNCENYNNGTCIQLNSAGNLIQGGYVESTGGKLLNDTNNLGNLNVGNTVILGGAIQEWYGRYGKGNNQGGIPILVAAVSQRVSSGSSISSTPLYTDPVSGDSSMYQIHYTVVTAGGGTGTVTVSYAANIPGIGFTGACSTTLSLSGANTISEGSCSVMSVGGGLSYASSGGSGAGYTVYTRVMKIG